MQTQSAVSVCAVAYNGSGQIALKPDMTVRGVRKLAIKSLRI